MPKGLYTINGIEWPGVTRVQGLLGKGDGLLGWAANCAVKFIADNALTMDWEECLHLARTEWREVRDEAMDIGSEVHDLIKLYIRHKRDANSVYRKEVENGFLAFLEWEKLNKIEWLEAEKEVFDHEHGFAGTLDAKCRFGAGKYEGRVFVIDFKVSKDFYDTMSQQVAAYRHADSLTTSIPADGMGVLRLDKETGEPDFKDYSTSYEKNRNSFFKLVEYYYSEKDRRLKNNPFTLSAAKVAAKGGKKTLADIKESLKPKSVVDFTPALPPIEEADWTLVKSEPLKKEKA